MCGHLYEWRSGDDQLKEWSNCVDKVCQFKDYSNSLYASLASSRFQRHGTRSSLCFEHSCDCSHGHCNHVCLDNFAGIWMLDNEVRWLARGKVLQRVFELRRELAEFMRKEKPDIEQFCNCYDVVQFSANNFNRGNKFIMLWLNQLCKLFTDFKINWVH